MGPHPTYILYMCIPAPSNRGANEILKGGCGIDTLYLSNHFGTQTGRSRYIYILFYIYFFLTTLATQPCPGWRYSKPAEFAGFSGHGGRWQLQHPMSHWGAREGNETSPRKGCKGCRYWFGTTRMTWFFFFFWEIPGGKNHGPCGCEWVRSKGF